MNINDINKNKKTMVSFEVFPPKTQPSIDDLFKTIDILKKADPSFISVTYGAGGSGRDKTVSIASRIKSEYGIEPLAHLTCVGADENSIDDVLDDMKDHGIQNILALRGDIPKDMDKETAFNHFSYASDLIEHIRKRDNLNIMAAAYPEAHPQSTSKQDDLKYLKLKQDLGVTRFNTQLCFNTDTILDFLDKAKGYGINIPISIGVMPVLQSKQILRMVSLSGCCIPSDLAKMISLYGEDQNEFAVRGLEYAMNQVQKLVDNGVDGIHLYTMNTYEASLNILKNTGLI